MIYVVAGVVVLAFIAAYADHTLPHECRTCGHTYASRAAVRRHRHLAHRD